MGSRTRRNVAALNGRMAHDARRSCVASDPRHAFLTPRGVTRSRISLAVAAALAMSAPRVHAAVATPEGPAVSSEGGGSSLETVIVTARKRTENLQDVPESVDVLTGRDLKNLGITSFDDYATKIPSISFISTGPGTQLFVMRGVSDGSNPTYANTSATGVFLDDVSLSLSGVQPDLHLYDIARIEVLNGPQGTTFGASSMAGAVRYITNKPDVHAFSAGLDFNGGSIDGGRANWTYEGFLNAPLIDGVLALRVSAFSDYHGGFINNVLTTRTWVNGTVSDNSEWARNHYNREHVEGGRIALKGVINDGWSATLTYTYQRQTALGAWDEDLANLGPNQVSRFGPESHRNEVKILDGHLDGDVGIADLVFASTYWSLPTRQWNEYSEYMQNYKGGAQQGFACLNDPVYGGGAYTGCNVPTQFYEYHTNPQRWSEEIRLVSKQGGRFHWLLGYYWERTKDSYGSTYYVPGLQPNGAAFQKYLYYYNNPMSSLPPGEWYGYHTDEDYLQTSEFANISFDVTRKLNIEAGVEHFSSNFTYVTPYGQFAYVPTSPAYSPGGSNKVNSRAGINYKITDKVMAYAIFSQGFRDGGSNSGYPAACYAKGVPNKYIPDTLNNFEVGWKTTSLNNRLLWNGAAYLMNWQDLQTLIYDVDICPSSSFNANVGKARIYGVESNIDFRATDHLSLQASGSYTDSHLISSKYPTFMPNVGERLPFVPYFSYSWNVRYEQPLNKALSGYGELDMAHKGDMWNDLHVAGSKGFPRILQPSYSILNLRLGLTPANGRWLGEFYITNLTNKNAIVYSNTYNYDVRETRNEPRVFGLRLNYRFGRETNSE
jgi:iron complex outermembrane recepter protein